MTESYLVVWVDRHIDPENADCQNILTKLRSIFGKVEYCRTVEECIGILKEQDVAPTVVISSGSLGQHLAANIHELNQLKAIYIFCGNKRRHLAWTRNWNKIKGIYTSITPICDALEITLKEFNSDTIPISFIPANADGSGKNLTQLEPSFMYTQIFKEILLGMQQEQQTIKDFAEFCTKEYQGDNNELEIIKEFASNYEPSNAIWWYTRECFTYKMLNKALRTLNGDIIVRMGFFLRDVHRQIQELYEKQVSQYEGKPFKVYRGQGLFEDDFKKLEKNKGGLISFNNFLSTSSDEHESFIFAGRASEKEGMVGVLFEITIDPSISSIPFASVQEMSALKTEEEILFSMHTVFRTGEIQTFPDNDYLYQVELKLTSDDDEQLRQLTGSIRKEAAGTTGWARLGNLLLAIGQLEKAEELYNTLLEQAVTDVDKVVFYHQLGVMKYHQRRYEDAVSFYEKSNKLMVQIRPANDPAVATSYNNIGLVYENMGDYTKALEYYDKAVKICKETLPENDPLFASEYNNIAVVYKNMGDYSTALDYYDKALKISKASLPENHPSLCTSYNNIGDAYSEMSDYNKALEYYHKALEIANKSLPDNHPDLATCYNNIGVVYKDIAENSKALEYFAKALKICKVILPENHPLLASLYNNIGVVYKNMGDYSRCLDNYREALKIRESALLPSDPLMAISYSNMGSIYDSMGDYSTALEYFEKALKIREAVLLPNHPDLATIHLNLAACYERIGNYLAALKALQNAFQIQEKAFQVGNLAFAFTFNRFGSVYRASKDYTMALEYFEKSLSTFQKTLPEKHPYVALAYTNIGDVNRLMCNYEKALSFHQKALDIQENVQCDLSYCATTYLNLGETYREMKDYSTALKYLQKGLHMREQQLPKYHPDLAAAYHRLAKLYLATQEYNSAMDNVQQAVFIAQEKLGSNHPHLVEYRETFEEIRKKL
ncbi:unnamed protein product [Rotaria socialis]|uniref:ADP ribosyltransferase domain-containing protein n=2 Tax=Rotaria socialis TaxID=392032 RepID=A0A818X6W3_9BILA|nr:unnamed protein product [Rotaria socialis]CAF3618865.1 unnamed protein product [Rotaria socialis]CAF3733302.1 unnamed protein product [Rotaria socialis]CAF3770221.1 unnamed protein product [Rotaria socialis]CAF4313889.1 unnamed protein product [Rotaria socialis]